MSRLKPNSWGSSPFLGFVVLAQDLLVDFLKRHASFRVLLKI